MHQCGVFRARRRGCSTREPSERAADVRRWHCARRSRGSAASPMPRTTSVPENTCEVPAPPGVRERSRASSRVARLRTASDSPVSSDSSICEVIARRPARRRPARGRLHRGPRRRRAPLRGPGCAPRWPSRITSARGLVRSRSASSARSLRPCWMKVIDTDSVAKASSTQCLADLADDTHRSPPRRPAARTSARAAHRPRCAQAERRSPAGSSLNPSASRRRRASAALRPVSRSSVRRAHRGSMRDR